MNSVRNTPYGVGFPIRKSPDQSLLATPRSLSQRATSFIASRCQGIHQMPFSCLRVSSMRRDKPDPEPLFQKAAETTANKDRYT